MKSRKPHILMLRDAHSLQFVSYAGSYSIEKLFEFQEALCYSQGRLDMPKLMDSERLKGSKWCRHPDLQSITKICFDAQIAQQTVLGGTSCKLWEVRWNLEPRTASTKERYG